MKKIFIILIVLTGCAPKVEFYYMGKPCYTRERCISRSTVHKCDYHFGMNPLTGKDEYFYGDYTEEECVEYRKDTIIIKK